MSNQLSVYSLLKKLWGSKFDRKIHSYVFDTIMFSCYNYIMLIKYFISVFQITDLYRRSYFQVLDIKSRHVSVIHINEMIILSTVGS